MSSVKKYQNKKILVEQLIEQGATKSEIAKQTEIPFGSINHYLKMWGLKTRNSWGKLDTHKEEILGKLDSGVSRKQIAQEYDVSENTLDTLLLKEGRKTTFRGSIEGKEEVEQLLRQGKLLREISEATGISLGSLTHKINSWGLKEIQKQFRPTELINEQATTARVKGIKRSHAEGNRHHWTEGLATVRGQWVSILEVKEELEYFVAQDIFIREMAEFMQVDPKTVNRYLKLFNLQQGRGRRGSRNKWWRGGHVRYRGSDWYSARQAALERDNHICQICGITEAEYREKSGRGLSVHHKEPYYFNQENLVDNLRSVCQPCHIKLELDEGRFAGQVRTYQQIE